MKNYLEDTVAYLDESRKNRILEELNYNAVHTIRNVYIFKHFNEYTKQLLSDKNEDRKDEYLNSSYYERLIDYVKISIAFETYNKAFLIEKGFLVHKIQKNIENKILFDRQQLGEPILIKDFLEVSDEIYDKQNDRYYLSGLKKTFETITYSTTLNHSYQEIIGLDKLLCDNLIEFNKKRNRLHFYIEFKGAFEVNSHLVKWKYIMDKSFETIAPIKKVI